MSVTVRHLNADSTFLLIFSHKVTPTATDLLSASGAFSVLIDPWFVGSSIVSASWFAITHRIVPSVFQHMSELEEPDVVLVSQNKPDHCHRETLLQLRPEGKTLIAAEPGAAKAIKKWDHFDPNRVVALSKYDAKARFGNSLRLRIPPLSAEGSPGEVNIAFIPAKNYATGLHNAFGITYQAPTEVKTLAPVMTIDLPRRAQHDLPSTPSTMPTSSPHLLASPELITRPYTSYVQQGELVAKSSINRDRSGSFGQVLAPNLGQHTDSSQYQSTNDVYNVLDFDFDNSASTNASNFVPGLSTPPYSPPFTSRARISDVSSSTVATTPPSTAEHFHLMAPQMSYLPDSPSIPDLNARYSRPPIVRPARPKAVSILYTPHGIPLVDLQPYIKTHLVSLPGALPLTLLLHSFDYAQNPWYFGGNIMYGAPGGVEIAKALMARTWISAHDEEKDDQGVAVKLLKVKRGRTESIKQSLTMDGIICDVKQLEVGGEIRLTGEYEWKRRPSSSNGSTNGLGLCAGGPAIHVNG